MVVDEDVQRLGGTINYKGQQVVVSLSGQTKVVDLVGHRFPG